MSDNKIPQELIDEKVARGLVLGALVQHPINAHYNSPPWKLSLEVYMNGKGIADRQGPSWAWVLCHDGKVWAQNQDDVIRKGDRVKRIAHADTKVVTGGIYVVDRVNDTIIYINHNDGRGPTGYDSNKFIKLKLDTEESLSGTVKQSPATPADCLPNDGIQQYDLLKFTSKVPGQLYKHGDRLIAIADQHRSTVACIDERGGKHDCHVSQLEKIGTVPHPDTVRWKAHHGKALSTDLILQVFVHGLFPWNPVQDPNINSGTITDEWWVDTSTGGIAAMTDDHSSLWLFKLHGSNYEWALPLNDNTDAGRSPGTPKPNTSDEQERTTPATVPNRRGQAIDPGPSRGCEVTTGAGHHGHYTVYADHDPFH